MTHAPVSEVDTSTNVAMVGCDAEAVLRAGTYSLLSKLLAAPPDRETLDLLTCIDRSPEGAGSLLGAAWQMLAMAADRADPTALDDEYHALFVGLGRGELVPYGSWYMTGFLMEQPLAQLRSDLKRLGFERQEGVSESEDHAAGLCDVMAMLNSEGEVAAYDLQWDFMDRHMLAWMPRFFRDLQKAEKASFYRAVGQLGEQFLEVEKEFLLASVPRSGRASREDMV